MVKLPMSDYVADYYKKQGIIFTCRQQAHFCWYYNELLKEQLGSLKEILEISDDEKLNAEIKERIAYEEKAYECFLTGQEGCIYIVHPDDEDEYDIEYFSSAENAIAYGVRHCNKEFRIEKCWLFDKNPEGLSEEADDDQENVNEILSWYRFSSEGDMLYGDSNEYKAPFDKEDNTRFEYMFLNIKSPFDLGDIVMGPDFGCPRVVNTDANRFMEIYDRFGEWEGIQLNAIDNAIRTDCIGTDGKLYYDHAVPFQLWKVDTWEDKEYWDILKILSEAAKAKVDVLSLDYFACKYAKRHS